MRLSYLYDMFLYIQSAQTVSNASIINMPRLSFVEHKNSTNLFKYIQKCNFIWIYFNSIIFVHASQDQANIDCPIYMICFYIFKVPRLSHTHARQVLPELELPIYVQHFSCEKENNLTHPFNYITKYCRSEQVVQQISGRLYQMLQ
jgi:hypothetical protein